MAESALSLSTKEQLETLTLAPHRPLIVCDADEVLLLFLDSLHAYLAQRDLKLDMKNHRITGNITHLATGAPFLTEDMPALMKDFFAAAALHMKAVPGAKSALKTLAASAQIVVLTNVPLAQKHDRIANLKHQGLPHTVVANSGSKGPAVAWLSQQVRAPIFFIDDLGFHIDEVTATCAQVCAIQFIANKQLFLHGEKPKKYHHRANQWPCVENYIMARLRREGF